MRAKIVYYGPATGGKTTNLQVIHSRSKQDKDLDLFSVDTSQNRTILFDLLPMSTPAFRNYQLRFQILGVPGQKLYATTRKMLLKNADSVVFVANSAADRWDESLESYREMSAFLLEQGIDPTTVPMVFQYNKRDLGDTVDVEVMERALNSRGASHFPAVASQEKGVLETFAAALKATMSDLAKRYQIASKLTNAHSIDEWAEQTMLFTFGVLRFEDNADYVLAGPSQPPEAAAEPKVVRVRTPSKKRKDVPATPARTMEPRTDAPGLGSPPSLQNPPQVKNPPAAVASVATATAPAGAGVAWDTLSAASKVQDAFSAQAMVDSYAEAAVGLADHISELREAKDSLARRGADFSVVSDTVKAILGTATPDDVDVDVDVDTVAQLEAMLQSLAANWEASHAALYITSSDGTLQKLVDHRLEVDPLISAVDPHGASDGVAIQNAGTRVSQMRGEEGPLTKTIKRVGPECVASAAFPLGTPNRRIGLLLFCFSQGAASLNLSESEHLDRVAFELSLGLHVLSDLRGAFWESRDPTATLRGA